MKPQKHGTKQRLCINQETQEPDFGKLWILHRNALLNNYPRIRGDHAY